MKRGLLLLLVGVTALWWALAPTADGAAVPTPAVQRTTTTTTTPPTTPPTTPETLADPVVEETVAPAAPTTVAASEATPRDDPAAARLRRVTYGLLGLGGLILIVTVVFWRTTRPALIETAPAASTVAPAISAPPKAKGGAPSSRPAAVAGAAGGAPAKIPASAFLATPPGSPIPGVGAAAAAGSIPGASVAGASILGASAPVVPSAPATAAPDLPADAEPEPPQGAPVIDAPAPLAGIPLGAPKPLVGNDSAWIIEPESGSGLSPTAPTAGDFPEVAAPVGAVAGSSASQPEPSAEVDLTDRGVEGRAERGADDRSAPIEVTGVEASAPPAAADYPAETRALISALSAIPDKEPTVVRFDDPPVERIPQRRRRPAPEPGATPAPRRDPSGAPGFDRIAKEATATHGAVVAPRGGDARDGRVDDMALMASALSSLPPRRQPEIDDPGIPPVGEFYDQDLDPGDPPGH